MFEFFRNLEKHAFLLPQEGEEDLFRLAHENSSFSVHKENIPFLLRKEQIYKQREGKPPVFGCRIRLWLDGFLEDTEEGSVFYFGGGKERVEVLEVLSDGKIEQAVKEGKLIACTDEELVKALDLLNLRSDEVAWDLLLIAYGERIFLKLEGSKKAKIVE